MMDETTNNNQTAAPVVQGVVILSDDMAARLNEVVDRLEKRFDHLFFPGNGAGNKSDITTGLPKSRRVVLVG